MSLLGYLFRRKTAGFVAAVFNGLVGGVTNTCLVVLIINALTHRFELDRDVEIGVFAALCVIMVGTRALALSALVRLGQDVITELRLEFCHAVLAAPIPVLHQLGPARLLAHLTEDVTSIVSGIETLPRLFINYVIIFGCLVYLGYVCLPLLFAVIGFITVGSLLFGLVQGRAVRLLHKARKLEDDLHQGFRGITHGAKELKLNTRRRRAFFEEDIVRMAKARKRYIVSGMSVYIFVANVSNSLFYVAIGLLIYAAPAYIDMGDGVVTSYTLILLYMMTPLAVILDNLPVMGKARVAWDSLRGARNSLQTAPGNEDEGGTCSYAPDIRLSGVHFQYHADQDDKGFAIGPVDLHLRGGESLFIVGGNGGGKSTLAMLLTGLLIPDRGAISLGGRVIDEQNREWYRQHFSAVFSDFYLFDRIIGMEHAGADELARKYLKQLRLDHKVRIENGSFSTTDLSQGQRKRLALLVAYMEDRPVYVFDEWAADQDPEFKRFFYLDILPALKSQGKTVVVITHDDAYFPVADRLMKLEDGRLVGLHAAETDDAEKEEREALMA